MKMAYYEGSAQMDRDIILDSEADLASVDGADYEPGRVAIVPGGKVYMLNASHEWVEV